MEDWAEIRRLRRATTKTKASTTPPAEATARADGLPSMLAYLTRVLKPPPSAGAGKN